MSFAYVFPGQGSQQVGMGKVLFEEWPASREVYLEADDILGFPISRLCFEGPDVELLDTYNAQPALLVTCIAALRGLEAVYSDLSPSAVAGHSLGEYAALVVADALTFPDALKLVRERGRVMKAAGERSPGGMAAVIGGDLGTIDAACRTISNETGCVLQVANDNCPGQLVVAGSDNALAEFEKIARQLGVKIFKRLAVSVACHTLLMSSAQSEFDQILNAIQFRPSKYPVCANMDSCFITTPTEFQAELHHQLSGTVQWTKSIRNMEAQGITKFCEIGPGQVLSGLIKRINPQLDAISFARPDQHENIRSFFFPG